MNNKILIPIFIFAILTSVCFSAYNLNSNETGGDCYLIGTWENNTCYLTTNISQIINIQSNGLTLDCQNYDINITPSTNYGIYVNYINNTEIINCNINSVKYGIFTNYAFSSIIKNNKINNVLMGMRLDNSNYNIVFNNSVRSTSTSGIWFRESSYNNISYNNVEYFVEAGIYLSSSANYNIVKNNDVGNVISAGGGPGIFITSNSQHEKILENNIYNVSPQDLYGIGLSATNSNDVNITLNNFTNNGEAIEIWNSYNVSVYRNNIIDSFYSSYCSPYACDINVNVANNNVLNLMSGGNYWSDHNNTDEDGDGFADNIYNTTRTAVPDYLPYANKSGWEIEIPDITPPNSITDLNATDITNESIYWIWTNPIDIDFNHSILYLDSVFLINTSDEYLNLSGLSANTSYTLTIWTIDNNGNINNTDVNDTETTYAVYTYSPPSTPPKSKFEAILGIEELGTIVSGFATNVVVGITPVFIIIAIIIGVVILIWASVSVITYVMKRK